jgi:hypothetical protein
MANPSTRSLEGPDPYACGSSFPNLEDAKDALVRFTVAQGLSYRKLSQDKRRYIVVCRSENCQFRLRLSILKSGYVRTTVSTPHSCPPETHLNWKPASSVRYLQQNYQCLIDSGGVAKPDELRTMERRLGNRVSYKQSWRAMKFARDHSGETAAGDSEGIEPNLEEVKS